MAGTRSFKNHISLFVIQIFISYIAHTFVHCTDRPLRQLKDYHQRRSRDLSRLSNYQHSKDSKLAIEKPYRPFSINKQQSYDKYKDFYTTIGLNIVNDTRSTLLYYEAVNKGNILFRKEKIKNNKKIREKLEESMKVMDRLWSVLTDGVLPETLRRTGPQGDTSNSRVLSSHIRGSVLEVGTGESSLHLATQNNNITVTAWVTEDMVSACLDVINMNSLLNYNLGSGPVDDLMEAIGALYNNPKVLFPSIILSNLTSLQSDFLPHEFEEFIGKIISLGKTTFIFRPWITSLEQKKYFSYWRDISQLAMKACAINKLKCHTSRITNNIEAVFVTMGTRYLDEQYCDRIDMGNQCIMRYNQNSTSNVTIYFADGGYSYENIHLHSIPLQAAMKLGPTEHTRQKLFDQLLELPYIPGRGLHQLYLHGDSVIAFDQDDVGVDYDISNLHDAIKNIVELDPSLNSDDEVIHEDQPRKLVTLQHVQVPDNQHNTVESEAGIAEIFNRENGGDIKSEKQKDSQLVKRMDKHWDREKNAVNPLEEAEKRNLENVENTWSREDVVQLKQDVNIDGVADGKIPVARLQDRAKGKVQEESKLTKDEKELKQAMGFLNGEENKQEQQPDIQNHNNTHKTKTKNDGVHNINTQRINTDRLNADKQMGNNAAHKEIYHYNNHNLKYRKKKNRVKNMKNKQRNIPTENINGNNKNNNDRVPNNLEQKEPIAENSNVGIPNNVDQIKELYNSDRAQNNLGQKEADNENKPTDNHYDDNNLRENPILPEHQEKFDQVKPYRNQLTNKPVKDDPVKHYRNQMTNKSVEEGRPIWTYNKVKHRMYKDKQNREHLKERLSHTDVRPQIRPHKQEDIQQHRIYQQDKVVEVLKNKHNVRNLTPQPKKTKTRKHIGDFQQNPQPRKHRRHLLAEEVEPPGKENAKEGELLTDDENEDNDGDEDMPTGDEVTPAPTPSKVLRPSHSLKVVPQETVQHSDEVVNSMKFGPMETEQTQYDHIWKLLKTEVKITSKATDGYFSFLAFGGERAGLLGTKVAHSYPQSSVISIFPFAYFKAILRQKTISEDMDVDNNLLVLSDLTPRDVNQMVDMPDVFKLQFLGREIFHQIVTLQDGFILYLGHLLTLAQTTILEVPSPQQLAMADILFQDGQHSPQAVFKGIIYESLRLLRINKFEVSLIDDVKLQWSSSKLVKVQLYGFTRNVTSDCDRNLVKMNIGEANSVTIKNNLDQGQENGESTLARAYKGVSLQFIMSFVFGKQDRKFLFREYLKLNVHSDMCPIHVVWFNRSLVYSPVINTQITELKTSHNQAVDDRILTNILIGQMDAEPFSFMQYNSNEGNLIKQLASLYSESTFIALSNDRDKAKAFYKSLKSSNINNTVVTVLNIDDTFTAKLLESPDFLRYQFIDIREYIELIQTLSRGKYNSMLGQALASSITSFVQVPSAKMISLAMVTFFPDNFHGWKMAAENQTEHGSKLYQSSLHPAPAYKNAELKLIGESARAKVMINVSASVIPHTSSEVEYPWNVVRIDVRNLTTIVHHHFEYKLDGHSRTYKLKCFSNQTHFEVYLQRSLDGLKIPYGRVHAFSLIALLRMGLLQEIKDTFYEEFLKLPFYEDMAPWNIVFTRGRLEYIDYDTKDMTFNKLVPAAYQIMAILMNYERTVADFGHCRGHAKNPYRIDFISHCVHSNFKGPCTDTRYPVPCGDFTCRTTYIDCLQGLSQLEGRRKQWKSIFSGKKSYTNSIEDFGQTTESYEHGEWGFNEGGVINKVNKVP